MSIFKLPDDRPSGTKIVMLSRCIPGMTMGAFLNFTFSYTITSQRSRALTLLSKVGVSYAIVQENKQNVVYKNPQGVATSMVGVRVPLLWRELDHRSFVRVSMMRGLGLSIGRSTAWVAGMIMGAF